MIATGLALLAVKKSGVLQFEQDRVPGTSSGSGYLPRYRQRNTIFRAPRDATSPSIRTWPYSRACQIQCRDAVRLKQTMGKSGSGFPIAGTDDRIPSIYIEPGAALLFCSKMSLRLLRTAFRRASGRWRRPDTAPAGCLGWYAGLPADGRATGGRVPVPPALPPPGSFRMNCFWPRRPGCPYRRAGPPASSIRFEMR